MGTGAADVSVYTAAYSSEALKARDVMAFPWDEAAAEHEAGLGGEDERQDIEAAKRLYGFR